MTKYHEIEDAERKITVHFNTFEDFNTFCSKNDICIPPTTKVYNWATKEVTLPSKETKKKMPFDKCSEHWKNMPLYNHDVKKSLISFVCIFPKDYSSEKLSEIFEQNVKSQSFVYYPRFLGTPRTRVLMCENDLKPKYPIYVVSRTRSKCCRTSQYLSMLEIPHYVVVEPFEVEEYRQSLAEYSKYAEVLELDMSYKDNYDTCDDLGKTLNAGPGGARNFVWDHSIKNGFKYHWVMDDNIRDYGFVYTHANDRITVKTSTMFRLHEEFVERYDNIAISGLNYNNFIHSDKKSPPYILNSRIYSFLFIRNDIPYRWRGRFNEDTDLSIRVLKDGWCTLENCAFVADKVPTQQLQGGNTEIFYKDIGTELKSEMIAKLHSDICKVQVKFHRVHHYVNYTIFKQKLHFRDDYIVKEGINNYGLYVIDGETKDRKLSVTDLKSKYANATKMQLSDLQRAENNSLKVYKTKENLENLEW